MLIPAGLSVHFPALLLLRTEVMILENAATSAAVMHTEGSAVHTTPAAGDLGAEGTFLSLFFLHLARFISCRTRQGSEPESPQR